MVTDSLYPDSSPDKVRFISQSKKRPLTKKQKQFLWECEEERFTYKACLRNVIGLERTPKHTSWYTAEVANIQLT